MKTPEYQVGLIEAANFSTADQAACIRVIEGGEAVDVESARRELPKAIAVAIARLEGQIVGVGAIKRQRVKYAAEVSKKAHFKFPAEVLELGYVAVDPTHLGNHLSHKLVAVLLAVPRDALFSTTSHPRMKETLKKAGFVQRGQEWDGNKSKLSLWLRDKPSDLENVAIT